MFPVLRRLPVGIRQLLPVITAAGRLLMDPITGNHRLTALAQQLRLYKAPTSTFFDSVNSEEEETLGKSISPIGFAAPSTSDLHKRASVLVCLFEGEAGDLRVFLTKRSSRLSTHSGEVSLPGGKAEDGDKDDADTATREAKEEIGLDPSLVNVVTHLQPFLSKHLLKVTPVIGILHDKEKFNPVLNEDEVDAIFDCPLEMFLKDENKMSEKREWMGTDYIIHYFDYEFQNKKYLIWGLTAGILIRAASVVFQRPACFEEQMPYFKGHASDNRNCL